MAGRRDVVADFWDEVVGGALVSGAPHRADPALRRWFAGYRGVGDGAVTVDATPEPYIGPLATRHGNPRLIALGLNPGPADLRFQGRGGLFAGEYERLGGFSSWAVSEPYLRDPWRAAHGRNRYHENLRAFARTWVDDPALRSRDVLVLELYPWHSDRATAAMAPPADVIDEFVWQPIAEIDLPEVIAVGAAWQRVAERLGLPEQPLEVEFTDPTRRARAFQLPSGQRLAVTWHQASNSPPNPADALALRSALQSPDAAPVHLSRGRVRRPAEDLHRSVADTSGRPSPRHPCEPFWMQLRARLERERPTWTLGRPNRNDFPFFSPLPGARIKCNFSRDGPRVELLLQSADPRLNTERLAVLTAHLGDLHAAFGTAQRIRPEPLDGKTQARIAVYRPGSIDQQDEWQTYQDWFLEVATNLIHALRSAPAIRAAWPR
jgi:hypothetical protein